MQFSGTSTCECGATIYWFITDKGRRAPYDDRNADVSHFATCPNAARFRRSH